MSAAVESLPPSAPTKVRGDFADWLSPVLVKELRQGLRSKAFVGIFIGVQVVMITMVAMWLASGLATSGVVDSGARDGFFWTLLGLTMLVVFPLRAMNALTNELKAKTLDLVQLTHLSAMRIVTGKWLAVVAQSALVTVSVLPYATLRYFFGRVNVMDDLMGIGALFLGSLLFTALGVAASLLPPILRALLIFAVVYMGLMGGIGMAFGRALGSSFGVSYSGPGPWAVVCITVLMVAAYTWLALTDAASKIAPVVENHASRKRGASLFLLAGLAVLSIWASADTIVGLGFALMPFLAWVCVTSLCESTVDVPELYRPWARRGWLARLAGRILYPGCATAVLFSLLASFLWVLLLSITEPASSGGSSARLGERDYFMLLAVPLVVVFPALIFACFNVKEAARIWIYVFVQVFCLVLAGTIDALPGKSAELMVSFLPASALWLFQDDPSNVAWQRFALMISGAVILLVFAIQLRKAFRWITHLENESLRGGRSRG